MITLSPYPVKHAKAWVEQVHRRLPSLHHRMWSVAAFDGPDLIGVAVVGAPKARLLAATRGNADVLPPPYTTLEVVRVAVEEGHRNVCSRLYGATARAARSMGALNLLTYTDEDEDGASLKAANFVREERDGIPLLFSGGQANRPARPRKLRQNVSRKHRWWAPWSEYLCTCRDQSDEVG